MIMAFFDARCWHWCHYTRIQDISRVGMYGKVYQMANWLRQFAI
jgi:hypothetical protein